MNDSVIKKHNQGFLYNDTLGTKLRFSGTIMCWEIDRVTKHLIDQDLEYWVIKDDYGARVSCFDKKLVESLHIAERYVVKGEIKIAKGATFLNLKEAEVLNGNDFQ